MAREVHDREPGEMARRGAFVDPTASGGGSSKSGFGSEQCLEEMLRFIREKNVHARLRPTVA
jgi:hypothetical protein